MATTRDNRTLVPGVRIKVKFGGRWVPGVVTHVSGNRIHVDLTIDGADEPVTSLYRDYELTSA
ncbi:hypothetical protein [Mycolicibacterium vinylchloridicum]|uniref:hypothetical protein n=1 Tax=Mycolicibacterium vinylchloridicum TaxID=2736928 RepID=UPI0015CB02E0|nr:hypothetical protein [Mycolicibacterium vinylchloridicum]